MEFFATHIQSWGFLLDYVRIGALGVFYLSSILVVTGVAAALVCLGYHIVVAGLISFKEGLKSEPVYTLVLALFFVFFSSGLLMCLLEPKTLATLLKGFVFL